MENTQQQHRNCTATSNMVLHTLDGIAHYPPARCKGLKSNMKDCPLGLLDLAPIEIWGKIFEYNCLRMATEHAKAHEERAKHALSPLLHHKQCGSEREYWEGAWVSGQWEGPWHLLKAGLLNAEESLELHYWLLHVEDLDRAFFFLYKTLWDQHEQAKVGLSVLEAAVLSHKFFD